jgi:hypothetical protein
MKLPLLAFMLVLPVFLFAQSKPNQNSGEFRRPPELFQRIRSHLPPQWKIQRATNHPIPSERNWTALPTLYYIHLEGPKKWSPVFFSGPPLPPEKMKHFFDERPEYVDIFVYSNNPLPSKILRLDKPNCEVLWTEAPYQAIGVTYANYTWPSCMNDLKSAFAEAFDQVDKPNNAPAAKP